jgi:hypothetical protein
MRGASASLIHAKTEQDMVTAMRQSKKWQDAVAKGDFTKQLELMAQVETAVKGKTGKEIAPWPQPVIDSMAANIVAGRQGPPTSSAMFGRGSASNPNTAAVMAKVRELDPNYDVTLWTAKQKAVTQLLGKDGDSIRSFTVLVHHLEFYDALAKALQTDKTRPMNTVVNEVARQFGMPEITNFDMAKLVIGDEIVKAVTGAGGTGEDRLQIQKTLDAANSPEQLAGVSAAAKKLAGGQLMGQLSKYRKLIEKGWLTANDIVPQETMQQLGFASIKDNEKVIKPGGRDLFDRWGVQETGMTIPAPKEDTAGSSQADPLPVTTKEDFDRAPVGAWIVNKNGRVVQKQ